MACEVNLQEIQANSPDIHHELIHVACNEIGRSLGLAHHFPLTGGTSGGSTHDCMATGGNVDDIGNHIGDPGGPWIWTYHAHHIDHINAWWP